MPHAVLRVGPVEEILAGEEISAYILNDPFDPGFVPWRADPGRVGAEPGVLGVVQPATVNAGSPGRRWPRSRDMLSGINT